MSPRRLALLLIAFSGAGALTLWRLGPQPPAWLPPCPFHVLTGFLCPGCGSTRALYAIGHGEWGHALAQNPLLVVVLPALLLWAVLSLWRACRWNLSPAQLPRPTASVALTVLLLYFLLRNLPWWPFVVLAPHG